MDYSPGGCKESDTTKHAWPFSHHSLAHCISASVPIVNEITIAMFTGDLLMLFFMNYFFILILFNSFSFFYFSESIFLIWENDDMCLLG